MFERGRSTLVEETRRRFNNRLCSDSAGRPACIDCPHRFPRPHTVTFISLHHALLLFQTERASRIRARARKITLAANGSRKDGERGPCRSGTATRTRLPSRLLFSRAENRRSPTRLDVSWSPAHGVSSPSVWRQRPRGERESPLFKNPRPTGDARAARYFTVRRSLSLLRQLDALVTGGSS